MAENTENFENKIIEVCDECGQASCYYGEFMCDNAVYAGTKKETVAELRKKNLENEEYWSDEKMRMVYGDPVPFGYKNETV